MTTMTRSGTRSLSCSSPTSQSLSWSSLQHQPLPSIFSTGAQEGRTSWAPDPEGRISARGAKTTGAELEAQASAQGPRFR